MTAEQAEGVMACQSQPGEALRKAREGRSMSLADVAAALHLSTKTLQNLESGAFDRLPGHTFARGYIRAYAKLLGMDQERLVLEFDQATGSDAKGSSVNSLGQIEEPARGSHGLLRLLSLAVLAALILVGFLWWQDASVPKDELALPTGIQQVEVESADGTTQVHPLELEDQAVEVAREETASGQSANDVSLDATVAAAADDAKEETATAVAASAAAVEPVATGTSMAATVTGAEVVAPVVTAPASTVKEVAVGAGEGLLAIRFTANCWTQVTDANGKVLLSGLRRPGEDIQLAVKLPLELRLGFASAARVTFNGSVVDTKPFLTGETARLKLGQ